MTHPPRTPIEIGKLLRERRKELGLTQKDVGLSIGANRMSVSTVERGRPGARLSTALAIATALGLDIGFQPRGDDEIVRGVRERAMAISPT